MVLTTSTQLFRAPGFDGISALASGDINGDGLSEVVMGSLALPLLDGSAGSSAGGIAVWLEQPGGSLELWARELIQ
jgi:hypothetical protein